MLENDPVCGDVRDIAELPGIRHYFLTYKLKPGEEAQVSIDQEYGHARAKEVIRAAIADYEE
ncbi:MAG: hypothetical protein QNI91_03140 [Arenicellales bacterium]|nr:hypothetical protein [Arenicellales bacterium]